MLNLLSGATVNPMTILYSTLVLLVLALLFGFTLAVLGKKFAVREDERIKLVREKLSGANCGGCGFAGCDAFAKAVVEGKADINACAATSADNKKAIADIMGQNITSEDTVIVVACSGGDNALNKYEYMGYGNCRSMELLGGGKKQCKWGCLGMGSCVETCPFGAMEIGKNGYAQVNRDKCVACGKCIDACPKRLVKRIPASAKYYVACSNCLRGLKDVRALCSAGCIGCGLCAKVCPNGAITLIDNLAVIDYQKCTGCGICASKCPSKCILQVSKAKQNEEIQDATKDASSAN